MKESDLCARLAAKLRVAPRYDRKSRRDVSDHDGFRALIAYIVGQTWTALPLTSVQTTNEGRIIGKVLQRGTDIALSQSFEFYVGLCNVGFAVDTICDLAEGNGLTNAERAFLLNALPRWSETETNLDRIDDEIRLEVPRRPRPKPLSRSEIRARCDRQAEAVNELIREAKRRRNLPVSIGERKRAPF